MTEQQTQAEVQQLLDKWNGALGDPAFRTALEADPKRAIEERFGEPVPDGLEIRVHVQEPGVLHIVLPAENATSELDEEALEMVAGGFTLIELLVVKAGGLSAAQNQATKRVAL